MSPSLVFDLLVGGLITGGLYALVALGLNLQYGLMRVLNVAHGEFLMVGGYLTYTLHTAWGVNPLLTVLVTGPAAFAAGLGLHRLLYARMLRAGESPEHFASQSLLLSFGGHYLGIPAAVDGFATVIGVRVSYQRLIILAVVALMLAALALLLSIGFYVFLRTTLAGTAIRALMEDQQGAQLVGVDVRRVHARCFAAGLAMATVAGSLVSMLFELTPFIGLPYTVTALVVVILGGLGNILGSVLAGLLLGLVETFSVQFATFDLRVIVSYAVLTLVLVLRPSGLLGR